MKVKTPKFKAVFICSNNSGIKTIVLIVLYCLNVISLFKHWFNSFPCCCLQPKAQRPNNYLRLLNCVMCYQLKPPSYPLILSPSHSSLLPAYPSRPTYQSLTSNLSIAIYLPISSYLPTYPYFCTFLS